MNLRCITPDLNAIDEMGSTKELYSFNRADLLKNFRDLNIMPNPFEILFLM